MRLTPKRKIFTTETNPANTSAAIQHILQNVDISQSIDDIPTDGTTLKAISSNWAYDHEALLTNYQIKQLELDFSQVSAHGKPTLIHRGVNRGFSLPLYAANEELFFNVHAPTDWDGTTDFTVYIDGYIDTANDTKNFQLRLEWENIDFGTDVVPTTDNDVDVQTSTGASAAQYQSYRITFTIDYDIDTPALVEAGDCICLRLTRIAASANEIAGEFVACKAIMKYRRNKLGASS